MRARFLLGLAAAFSGVVGCSLALSTSDEQCKTDGDCAARGGAFAGSVCRDRVCVASPVDAGGTEEAPPDVQQVDPTWGCLGSVTFPTAVKPQVTVKVPFIDLVTKAPMTELTIKVCAKLDVSCTSPLGQPLTPDSKGVVTVPNVAAGFDGYLDVQSSQAPPDGGLPAVVPSLVFFNPPLVDDTTYATILMLTPATLAQLATTAGNTLDPSLGAAFYGAVDCQSKFAADVACTIDRTDPQTKGFFLVGGLPSETASSTDSSGYGGFINVPTGYIRLTATVHSTSKRIGETSVLVRPSTISYTFLVPSP